MLTEERRTTWKAIVTGVILFVTVDAVVFRTGLYAVISKPDSNAGVVVRETRLEPELHPPIEQPTVLLIGDSRLGEACIPQLLCQYLGMARDSLQSAAVPGSTPRVWALLYESIPQPENGWRLVIVGLPDYDDDAVVADLGDRELGLALLTPLLGIGDALTVASEFSSYRGRRDAVLGGLFKAYAWRHDVRDFLAAPIERLEAAVDRDGGWQAAGSPMATQAPSKARVSRMAVSSVSIATIRSSSSGCEPS